MKTYQLITILTSLFTTLVTGSKLIKIETDTHNVGAICISIPHEGDSFPSPLNMGALEEGVNDPKHKRDVSFTNEWVLDDGSPEGKGSASLQYFVRERGTGELYWAGEAIIPWDWLVPGTHVLDYEESITYVRRHSLHVWWNNKQIPFYINKSKSLTIHNYYPDHVTLFGPLQMAKSAHSVCKNDGSSTYLVHDYRSTLLLPIVTVSIITVLVLTGLTVMVCLHCCSSKEKPGAVIITDQDKMITHHYDEEAQNLQTGI